MPLDGRPGPATPLGEHPRCRMVVRCQKCGRHVGLPVRDLIERHGIAPETPIYVAARRLRCSAEGCGGEGAVTDVEGWVRGRHRR